MSERIALVLKSLDSSKFRSRFKLNEKDRDYLRKKGFNTIRNHAIDFINTRVAPGFPKNDGKQTPMRGHPAFVAQHATATCCRGCIQKWHGIGKGKDLNKVEVEFFADLIMAWIEKKVNEEQAGV